MTRTKSILIGLSVVWIGIVLFVVAQVISLKNALEVLPPLLFAKNITSDQIEEADEAVKIIGSSAAFIAKTTNYLTMLAPQEGVQKVNEVARNVSVFADNLPTLLGRTKEQHYVVFFLNNRELRPGGGFIGSLAFITLKNYSVSELVVEDVYEIDGQIVKHFPPHPSVSQYLQVPHLFLRDSNFSPDFAENVRVASVLLKEAGRTKTIDGAVGLTTSAIEQIIEVFGDIYVPDYNQTVTKDNFYIVTQTKVETNFFPGSLQKKSFLSALTKSLFVEFETVDKGRLVATMIRNLNAKNIVIYSAINPVEKQLKALNWSGSLTTPNSDYIFPIEANVGANKANYFTRREMSYKVTTQNNSKTSHEFVSQWKNESPENDFLGGTYKNFFQLYIPRDSVVSSVFIDDLPADIQTQRTPTHMIVSTYLEIKPKETKSVTIKYASPALKKGDAPYSLTIQKQTGSQNSDIEIAINSYVTSIPLSKDVVISLPRR